MIPDLLHSRQLNDEAQARGVKLTEAGPLAGDGSDRRFFRLPGEPSLVLLYHPQPPGREVTENDSYFLIGRHLKGSVIHTQRVKDLFPEIILIWFS